MLPALNIPTLASPQCPIPLTHSSLSTALRDFSPCGWFNNTIPFPVPIPVPGPPPFLCCLPLPLPIFSHPWLPLPIIHSLRFPCWFLATLHVLLTLAFVIVIAIARIAPSTAQSSWICSVLIIIILVNYLIPIVWSNSEEVAWLVLPAAWRLNLCPVIIATVPREMLAGVLSITWAGCLQIGAIDLIPKGTGVVLPPMVHLIAGYVKHLAHI